jgi:signal transduction histidine kinase
MRNLTLSLGVLGILAASLALILIASAREQRMARQQLEFVASVSHELRTPLAVIRSAGENLADGVVSGEQVTQYGALIRNEGRRLSDMVERVMDFAGMTSGTLIRSSRPTDVKPLVHATLADLQAEAAARQVGLHMRAATTLPLVDADADALRSALQNVVGNAIKYSNAGGEIEVDVVATDKTLRICVSDRGLGIDANDLPHVFKPFYRGRRAVDAQIRGSGVGLSVVQKIVQAHGGEVRVAARGGGGTVVTIDLPAMAGASTEPA